MTPTIIVLDSENQILDRLEALNLPLSTSLTKLCVYLINQAFDAKIETIIIKIDFSLVSPSYLNVPAMYARTIQTRCHFPIVHSRLVEEHLIIRASQKAIPLSFKQKVKAALVKVGEFQTFRYKIPRSYRRRPSLLAKVLGTELCQRIATVAKKKTIIWKVADIA